MNDENKGVLAAPPGSQASPSAAEAAPQSRVPNAGAEGVRRGRVYPRYAPLPDPIIPDVRPIEAYDKVILDLRWHLTKLDRLIDLLEATRPASGTDARSVETAGLDPKDDGPATEGGDAHV